MITRKIEVNNTSNRAVPLLPAEKAALEFLLPLSSEYPEIFDWYVCKVVPGLRAGTRLLHAVERNGSIVGVGIAKLEDEKKICTVRVSPEYVGRGVGVRLFDQLLKGLRTDMPCLTVSETKLPAFQRIFDSYGFKLTGIVNGRYVPGVVEYSFNGERP
ncbi:MAG: GNAT family N-acetyltransferase [Xanthobacteraceae bacterium]